MSKIYPNLRYEEERRGSTQLQTNCANFLNRGTEITKEILEKLEEGDIGPPKASLCGRNFNARQLWVLSGLCLLFSTSCLSMGLMFGTNTFDSYVLSNLILQENSTVYDLWKGPLIKTYIKVYAFNYTNVEQYEDGTDEKLHVEEVGPYVYEELLERTNIRFLPNGTVSFQEKRVHHYRQDLSNGREKNETVTVPNLTLMSAAALGKKSFYVTRVAMSALLKGLFSRPFLNLELDKYIWGYDDAFFALAKSVMSFQKKLPFDKVGILANKNGLSSDVLTVHTGINDIQKVQQLDNLNGNNHVTQWTTEKCNKIKGSSDASNFPPFDIRQKQPISVFNKDVCRDLPLVYEKEVNIFNGKIPAYKYVFPLTTFDSPESNPENSCFCDKETGECSPKGLFNAESCSYGAPIFISLPHFYNAEPNVRQAVTGLNENPSAVESYIYVHPTMGFTMTGKNRIQLNVKVQKSFGMDQLNMFEDDIILPMAWFEVGLEEEELPDLVKDNIYLVSNTVPAIKTCLSYGSLLASIVTLTAILIILRNKWIQRRQKIRNNLS